MATTVTHTIAASGGDYSTVAAWESAQQGDLVTADEIRVGEVTGTVTEPDSSIAFSGWTTDSTRYPIIRAASGEEFVGNPSAAVANIDFLWNGAGNAVNVTDCDYLRFYGLHLHNTSSTANKTRLRVTSSNVSVDRCWIQGQDTGSSNYGIITNGESLVVKRSYITGFFYDIHASAVLTNPVQLINSVFKKVRAISADREVVAYNCHATDWNGQSGGTLSGDYNSSVDAEAPGANSIHSIVEADEFQNPAANDFRIQTDSQLLEAGTDKSAYLTEDVEGDTITTWMIGFDYEIYSAPIDIAATTDSLNITPYAANVQADIDTNITATTDALTLTKYDATVQADVDTSIVASTDTLNITGVTANVQADVDTNITATTDALNITPADATVLFTFATNIEATTDELNITAFNANIQADVDTDITATTYGMDIVFYNASVTIITPILRLNANESATYYLSNGTPHRIFN